MTIFFIPKTVTVAVAICDSFLTCTFLLYTYTYFYSAWSCTRVHVSSAILLTQIYTMYSVLLCMLFLSGWPPCQRSDMILMEVSQRAYDMIHYISGLFGYFYDYEIYVNLIWYLYLFMLNKFCLSLSLSLSPFEDIMKSWCINVYDCWL